MLRGTNLGLHAQVASFRVLLYNPGADGEYPYLGHAPGVRGKGKPAARIGEDASRKGAGCQCPSRSRRGVQ